VVRDSYQRFFDSCEITRKQFFEFGLQETIFADPESARLEWSKLKHRVASDSEVYMRGFGKNSVNSSLYVDLYGYVIKNKKVRIDKNNNTEPTKLIRSLTGYSKTPSTKYKLLRNYQISHVFGRTKNIYAFTAPWNIVYVPKILDPFTGHEAKGTMIDEYTHLFQRHVFERFKPLIAEFNDLMTSDVFKERVSLYLTNLEGDAKISASAITNLKRSVAAEFKPILL
jgi:hypothetical protein